MLAASALLFLPRADSFQFVAAIQHALPPRFVPQIPQHRLADTGFEILIGRPAQIGIDLAGIT